MSERDPYGITYRRTKTPGAHNVVRGGAVIGSVVRDDSGGWRAFDNNGEAVGRGGLYMYRGWAAQRLVELTDPAEHLTPLRSPYRKGEMA